MKASIEQQVRIASPQRAGSPVPALEKARVAIVHYWFVSRRGGEKVVEAMAAMFPHADLFSLIIDPDALPESLRGRSITTSILQKLPGSHRYHRRLLPFYPLALEQFDLSGYDLVLSSESGPSKGVLTSAGTCHVCYCHSPMRYLWDFYHRYKNGGSLGLLSRPFFTLASHYLRLWDSASADRVDYFAANSRNVAARIRKHYRREAAVIYPPVNTKAGYVAEKIEDYYLVVGQLVEYKHIDLAIAVCNRLGRRLRIVGEGEQYSKLRKLAGSTIQFCGALSDEDLHEQYAHCRALLFPGEEDFGIVPVEALSFGRPVIAYGRGGVTETVDGFHADSLGQAENASGIFFREQSIDSLVEAIVAFEELQHRFCPFFIKQQANRFAEENFQENFGLFLAERWQRFYQGGLDS
jgi:glycosyltransferase involved in cell wall biosynthesis